MSDARWPALPYEEWKETYQTLHMWTQVVGKVALAQSPPLNHSWGIAMHVTPRGIVTRTLPYGERAFTIEFDFVEHQLEVRVSDGTVRAMPLRSQSVADFYRDTLRLLGEMGLSVRIWPMAVEIATPIRLDQDTAHHTYVPEHANRAWRVIAQFDRVFNISRCQFVGKCSPVHFFWGGFDLAVTRFSGRTAPPREGPAFMQEAYSHEVISHGLWPGGELPGGLAHLESVFYAYAVPEPPGLKEARVEPAAAYYHRELGEFILPYEAVRTASDPDRALLDFVDSTYDRAASLGKWDRPALEKTPSRQIA